MTLQDQITGATKRFYNGPALKIGEAGKSEGIVNVKKEIVDFLVSEIEAACRAMAEDLSVEKLQKQSNIINEMSDIEWDKLGLSNLADELGRLLILIYTLSQRTKQFFNE